MTYSLLKGKQVHRFFLQLFMYHLNLYECRTDFSPPIRERIKKLGVGRFMGKRLENSNNWDRGDRSVLIALKSALERISEGKI